MGKGGCSFSPQDQSICCIRVLIGCLSCFFIAGPIMMSLGFKKLTERNTFDADVSTYKTAISTYKSGSEVVMRSLNAQMDTTNFTIKNEPVIINGDSANEVPLATSIVLMSTTSANLTYVSFAKVFASNRSSSWSVFAQIPSSYGDDGWATGSVTCRTTSSSSSGNSAKSSSTSSTTTCSNADCEREYGQGVPYASSRSMCVWYQYWRYACVPLSISTTSIAVDTTMGSCDYINLPMGTYREAGFGKQPLTMSGRAAPENEHRVKFMASDDPYIVASRITKGTMDFGPTREQQRAAAFALIIPGAAITAIFGGLITVLFLWTMKRQPPPQQDHGTVFGAFGQQQAPYMIQEMAPQPYLQQQYLPPPTALQYSGNPYPPAPPQHQQQQGYYAGGLEPGYAQPYPPQHGYGVQPAHNGGQPML